MSEPVRIALAGAGLIGRRHVETARATRDALIFTTVVDPTDDARQYALEQGLRWYPSLRDMFAVENPDGVIVATPNQVHLENALDCVAAKCPMLMEKPIASTSEEAQKIVDAATTANVPVLVGHHRRHNPLIAKARELIDAGELGRITAVHASCWFLKPDIYYDLEWRRKRGAGVVPVNAVHDIDLLRYLCGDVRSVHALGSSVIRGFEIPDTAAAMLKFESGAIGTITLSDTIVSPWSWEMTSGENPAYPATTESSYMIGGTRGSLSIPDNRLWRHGGEGHWMEAIGATTFPCQRADPLVVQLRHFADVIRGEVEPLVSGEEGMKSLQVIEAIIDSIDLHDVNDPG